MTLFPFTPGMRNVFEVSLPEISARVANPSLAVLIAVLKEEECNGARMIREMAYAELPTNVLSRIKQPLWTRRLGFFSSKNADSANYREAYKYLWKAKERAVALNHTWVGTEHLVLALLTDTTSKAYEELSGSGVNISDAEKWLERLLEESRRYDTSERPDQ